MGDSIFREEAIRSKAAGRPGSINLSMPASAQVGTIAAVLVTVLVFVVLWFGHYTRKARVSGSLVPTEGLVTIVARDRSIVERIEADEGKLVKAGDTLIALSMQRNADSVGDTTALVSSSLRRDILGLERDATDAVEATQKQDVALRIEANNLTRQVREISLQRQDVDRQRDSLRALLEKVRPLLNGGYISVLQVQQQELQLANADGQARGLARQELEIQQRLEKISYEIKQVPLTARARLNDIERQRSQREQALARNEAERSIVLKAPVDAVITASIARLGQSVAAGDRLITLSPTNSSLQAQLLVPSASIGFIRPGMKVSIHYKAFPYQKFGVQKGVIKQISMSALTATELRTLLDSPGESPDPIYRVLVDLERQEISAYGKAEGLKSGMALEADVHLDRRRLIEFVLEPLYGMRRKMESNG